MFKSRFGLIPLRRTLEELKSLRFYRDVLIESVVSFLLLFTCIIVASPLQPDNPPPMLNIGLVSGLYVYVLIEAFGHLQWSTMNPMCTLAFVCTHRISFIKGGCFVLAQMAGGTAGASLAIACTPVDKRENIAPFGPGEGFEAWQSIVTEMVLTSILVFVTLGSLDEDRRQLTNPGLAIGMTLALGITAGGPYSGGGMNASIAFSMSAATNIWHNLWIYYIGDVSGGVIAIVTYWFFVYDKGWFSSPLSQPSAEEIYTIHLDSEEKVVSSRVESRETVVTIVPDKHNNINNNDNSNNKYAQHSDIREPVPSAPRVAANSTRI